MAVLNYYSPSVKKSLPESKRVFIRFILANPTLHRNKPDWSLGLSKIKMASGEKIDLRR